MLVRDGDLSNGVAVPSRCGCSATVTESLSCGSHRSSAAPGHDVDGVRRASPSPRRLDRSSTPSLVSTLKPAATVEYLTEVTTHTCR